MQEQLRDALLGPIMADGMSHGLIVISRDYRILFWNRWLEKATGIKTEECLGQSLFALFPAIRERDKERFIRRCVENQTPMFLSPSFHEYLIPVEIVRNDEQTQMMQIVSIYPSSDAQFEHVGAVIVIEDATEQQFHEGEILRLNRVLCAIRKVNQLIARASSEEEVLQGACQILTDEGGYVGSWIGFMSEDTGLIHPVASARGQQSHATGFGMHDVDPEHCPVYHAIRTVETQTVEPKEGSSMCFSCPHMADPESHRAICSVPLVVHGVAIGALTVCSGVTGVFAGDELKLLAEIGDDIAFAIRAHREVEQRQRAEERERILQEQAEQHQRLAVIGQLAAGIAHDFNNILTGIMGHAEMMLMTSALPTSVQNDGRTILQQGKRAAKLVRQILDFSRKSILQKRPLDLWPFLRESIGLLQRTIPEYIRISFASAPGTYTTSADSTQLQQVLMNLALNAKDAMVNGGELRVGLSRLTLVPGVEPPVPSMSSGEWLVLSVADTGTGMSAEVLEHIYEPFFTTKGVGGGSGLGLSQAYGIISQHGGFIDVESSIGEGTTFSIYLPTIDAPAPSPQKTDSFSLPQGSGETILLVEDEPMVLDVLQRMLSALNYGVLAARDGQAALEVYREHREKIALVLTDVAMPRLGGVELHARLRQEAPEAKVILISGYPLGEESLPEGVGGWIEKPPTLTQLARVIASLLR